MKKYSWINEFEGKKTYTYYRKKLKTLSSTCQSGIQVFLLMTLMKPVEEARDPRLRTELLSVSWRLCPHNELQCESCSNYDSFRWQTGENWTWIFHNLHLVFKWEIILESHANFCHGPEFPITVIGKVSEGVAHYSR